MEEMTKGRLYRVFLSGVELFGIDKFSSRVYRVIRGSSTWALDFCCGGDEGC